MINGFQYSCFYTPGSESEKWWRMEKCFVCGVNGINSRRRNYGKFYKWLLHSSMGYTSLLVIVIVTNEGLVLKVNIILWGGVLAGIIELQISKTILKFSLSVSKAFYSSINSSQSTFKFTLPNIPFQMFHNILVCRSTIFPDARSIWGEFPISQLI